MNRRSLPIVDGVARKVAEVLTSAERSAVEANQDFGVVGGVENGRSGVMDFRLGDAAVSVGPGADPGSSQPYFYYDFYTEVCRANIEEGIGGAKQCVIICKTFLIFSTLRSESPSKSNIISKKLLNS